MDQAHYATSQTIARMEKMKKNPIVVCQTIHFTTNESSTSISSCSSNCIMRTFFLARELPEGSQCDFDTRHFDDQMFDTLAQYSEVCGWKIPHHSAKSMSDILANGAVDKHSSLKIDLEIKPNEKIILSSPVFPPPPKYNNDKASPFFESCKVMSIHLTSYFLLNHV